MGFPKIKYPLLCRIMVYVVVIGGFALPVIIASRLDFLSDGAKAFVLMASLVGFLIYIIKNFVVLMGMDLMLAMMRCFSRGRKFFVLRDSFTAEKAEKRISRFGKSFDAASLSPRPTSFRYRALRSQTVFADRIEKVFLVYHIDHLDKESYRSILLSAKANVRIFEEKNKASRKKPSGKKVKCDRVTVIVIFAKRIEDILDRELPELLPKNSGDGFDTSILPCVVDLNARKCTFDSVRIPYTGIKYPVKNRGIRMILRYLFGGKFPYAASTERVESDDEESPEYFEQSLWKFWRELVKEDRLENRNFKRDFKKMEHGELRFDGDYLYLKWNDRGVWQVVKLDEEQKLAEVDAVEMWVYPKSNKIAKATIKEIHNLIRSYFRERGYDVRFIRPEDG